MVRSNMGLLLSNNITTITVDVHKDEAAFNIQIVTTPFHEENENLQLQGISFTNFNDMWAFVPENQLDKTILRFDRDATGKPTASFYAPAFENQQEQEVMTVADNKLLCPQMQIHNCSKSSRSTFISSTTEFRSRR